MSFVVQSLRTDVRRQFAHSEGEFLHTKYNLVLKVDKMVNVDTGKPFKGLKLVKVEEPVTVALVPSAVMVPNLRIVLWDVGQEIYDLWDKGVTVVSHQTVQLPESQGPAPVVVRVTKPVDFSKIEALYVGLVNDQVVRS